MRRIASISLVALTSCGGTPQAVPPTPAPPAASTAPESPKPEAPKPDAPPDKPTEKDKPKGPFHWTKYSGPKVKTTIATKKAWALIPIGLDGDFEVAKLALLDYVRADGDEHVLMRIGKEQVFVPQAVAHDAPAAKGVKKGSTLLVDVAAASAYARVTAVDGDQVKFQYLWAGSVSEGELPLDGVVLVEDKIGFGQMVEYEDKGGHPGTLVYNGKPYSVVLAEGGRPRFIGADFVKTMKVTKPLKKGDKVRAQLPHQLLPGKVVEVLSDGLQYKVKSDEGKEDTLPFHLVSAI